MVLTGHRFLIRALLNIPTQQNKNLNLCQSLYQLVDAREIHAELCGTDAPLAIVEYEVCLDFKGSVGLEDFSN